MKIRKQVYDLTLEDLDEYPAWEFALDEEGKRGQDEATVRPIKRSGPVDPRTSDCLVRTSFILSDGTKHCGLLSPPVPGLSGGLHIEGDDGTGSTRPSILTNDSLVMFWYGARGPRPGEISKNYQDLGGKTANQVFPIRYCTDVPIVGGPVKGEIRGFMFVEGVECELGKRKLVARMIQQ